jgi:TMEM175 potassium channel family protein
VTSSRLEAFSDGVLAIVITIMVLELRVPLSEGLDAGTFDQLREAHLGPVFLSYVMSFIYIAIYWNNHHHLLYTVESVSASVLWANMNLLFWLSLVPFTTSWLGEYPFESAPTALYGVVLLAAGAAYYILERLIIRGQGIDSVLAAALGADRKGIASVVVYAAAIGVAFVSPGVSYLLYVFVAVLWLIPDRRIERAVRDAGATNR